MEKQLCLGCMRERNAGERVCPVCGYRHGTDTGEEFTLRPGSVLNNMYLVGKVIGQGGFGITYVGYDMVLERKVAIKEYFPMSSGMVSRSGRTSVVWSQQLSAKNNQRQGFDSFLKEARKMAKLEQIPAVVGVKGVFLQNGTAYIAMDFIEGETLKNRLMREGTMSFADCVRLLTPIIRSMALVHENGIIHRDISPDNIMIDPEGNLLLLDLGAAKDMGIPSANGAIASQLVAKHGFSPPEQYMTQGKIGSWTDVYAMCATIYYCVTGRVPPQSSNRLYEDKLVSMPPLTEVQFDVLSRGMGLFTDTRIQTMGELLDELRLAVRNQRRQQKKKRKIGAALAALAMVFLVGLSAALYAWHELSTDKQAAPLIQVAPLPTEQFHGDSLIAAAAPAETETVHVHAWQSADCTSPMICSLCGESQGSALGHDWAPATWLSPKQCKVCGITEGRPQINPGDVVTFGSYEQDGVSANGKEPIQWQVLDVRGNHALLISQYALDAHPYNYEHTDVTWETCDLRAWLNGIFFQNAFTAEEQQRILTSLLDNSASECNPSYNTYGGNTTFDKLFALSYREAWTYFPTDESRACGNTPYAAARAREQLENAYNASVGKCWWWLRSPGDIQKNGMNVFGDGRNRLDVASNTTGLVRPAMWISLEG